MKNKSETVEGKVAEYLAGHPEAKPKEIAAALTLNPGSVAGALSKLKRKDGHVPATRAPRTAKKTDSIADILGDLKKKREAKANQVANLEKNVTDLERLRTELASLDGAIASLTPKEEDESAPIPTNGQASHVQASEEASLS